MTALSPAAQVILEMVNAAPHCGSGRIKAAAALRAAAHQVVSVDNPLSFSPGAPQAFAIQRRTTRRQLLAIAAELEGQ